MSIRTRIPRLITMTTAAAGLGLAGAACVPLKTPPAPPAPPPLAEHVETFAFIGDPQEWVVPPGVTQATFDIRGGRGGGTSYFTDAGSSPARAIATLPLTPGETVHVYVGSAGYTDDANGCDIAWGGFNGGGDGGRAHGWTGGGGGGGATDIRRGGDTLAHRVLVAGGGGGAGAGNLALGHGGDGGVPVAEPGEDGTTPGVEGGYPATLNAWGGGGWGDPSPSADGDQGGLGQGGAGGGDLNGCPDAGAFYGGGGGGGGYYGGGGGGADADPGPGEKHAGGGGGGSSYGPPGTVFQTGTGGGVHGVVTITYLV